MKPRLFLRWPIRCELQCEAGPRTLTAESVDISVDGISFVSSLQLPIGAEMILRCRPQPDDPLITVRIVVLHRNGNRYGARFLNLSDEHRQVVLRSQPAQIRHAADGKG